MGALLSPHRILPPPPYSPYGVIGVPMGYWGAP